MLRIFLGVILIVGGMSAPPLMEENDPDQPDYNNENSTISLDIPTYPDYAPAPAPAPAPSPVRGPSAPVHEKNQDNPSKQSMTEATESNLELQESWKTRIFKSLEPMKGYALAYAAFLIDTLVSITSTLVVGLISTSIFCSVTSLCNFEINGVGSTTDVFRRMKGVARYLNLSPEEMNDLTADVNKAVTHLKSRVTRSEDESFEPLTFEEATKTRASPLDHLDDWYNSHKKPRP